MGYTLKVLSDFEFDSLPYKHARESLGLANPKTGTAFVRRTGIRPLDAMVTEHELDELVNKYSEHEDVDGIRYKKWGRIIAPVAAGLLTGGLGAAFGAPAGLASLMGGTAGAATGGLARGGKPKEWLPAAAMGGLAGYGGGALGAGGVAGFKGATALGTSRLGGTLRGAGKALGFGAGVKGGTIPAATIGTAPGISGAVGPTGGYAVPGFAPSITGFGAAGPRAAGAGLVPGFGAGTPASQLGFGGGAGLRDGGVTQPSLKQQLTGAAIPLLGGGLAPKAQPFSPEESEIFNEVLGRVRAGTTLELTPEQRTAIETTYDRQLESARESIISRFKALRPGSDISTDSTLREALTDLESDFAERRATAIVGAEIGLTQYQTQMLMELAGLDVYALSQRAGISAEEAQQFREMLADLGIGIATGGFAPSRLGGTVR